jgi:integrase
LTWDEVELNPEKPVLNVRRRIYKRKVDTPKTEASLRSRVMPQELYRAMLSHRQLAKFTAGTVYVFASRQGTPLDPDRLRRHLQGVLRELGIKLPEGCDGLHLLRHTSGSGVYQEKGVKEAQQALGHADVGTTLRVYTHVAEGSELEVARDVFSFAETPSGTGSATN